MIGLILRSMRNQKSIMLMFIIAFTLILTTIPLALTSSKEMMTQVDADITEYGRGAYDLLVRPEGARREVEQALGVVEENYLGVGEGGISLAEWREIQQLDGVEVAAPVASLGYFTGVSKSFTLWMPEQSVRVTNQLFTTDGVERYPLTPALT